MLDWAEGAAERQNENERVSALDKELRVEQLRRSKHIGPRLMSKVYSCLNSQIEKFNELRGRDEVKTDYVFDTHPSKTGNRDHEICVKWIVPEKPSLLERVS